jgi:hypothetical protein
MSLVVPYHLPSMRSGPTPHLKPGTLVRFSIGLEAAPDLRADLAQALEVWSALQPDHHGTEPPRHLAQSIQGRAEAGGGAGW